MVVSHVTNKMVENESSFIGSSMHQSLQNILVKNILVAHNAKFDIEMLNREGIETSQFIDTYKVVYHLDSNGEIPKYSLQYLRYYHELDAEGALAHNAFGDIIVLEKLFELYFLKMLEKIGDGSNVIKEMVEVSSLPILYKKFTFGKYNGREISDIANEDTGYLLWLFNQKIMTRESGGENDEDWIYTLEHYLNPIIAK